jgi:hypothetical protein
MPSVAFSPPRFSALPPFSLAKPLASPPTRFASTASSLRFDWADALRFGSNDYDDPSDISGFFQKVSLCNRGSVSPQFSLFLLVFAYKPFKDFEFLLTPSNLIGT